MRSKINPAWKDKMLDAIEMSKHSFNPEPFLPVILSWNKAAQWLVAEIAKDGQVPKVENLGAGVKRVSIKGTCCPTCGKVEHK